MKVSEAEFTLLVKEHRSTIYTVCYMFSNDTYEVADLFQEVLINMWKGLEKFLGNSDMKTWIYRVALNTCVSADRKKKRHTSEKLDITIDLFDDSRDDPNQSSLLHRRISLLRPFDRAIVLLWLENMSYEEIGAIVGITAKNVSVRLFRIKEELKRIKD